MDQIQLGLSGLTGTILDQPSQTHTDINGPKSIPLQDLRSEFIQPSFFNCGSKTYQ